MNTPLHPEHDDLERQLQAQLEHFAPEAPDRLWAGIEARLPKRYRRRPVLWWWVSGVGAALVLVGIGYRFAGQSGLSTPKPRSIELVPAVKQDIAIRTTPKQKGKETSTSSAPIPHAKLGPGVANPKAVIKFLADLDAITLSQDAPEANTLRSGILPERPPFEDTETVQDLPVTASDVTLMPLKSLFFPLPVLNYDLPKIQPFHLHTKTIGEQRWQIAAATGPVWLWQTSAPSDPHHGGHIGFAEHRQGAATGWQQGVNVEYELSQHWKVNAGLFRRQTTQIASHTATLRLMDGVCLNPNDYAPKEYEFQYHLYSGSGTSNLTVHIAQVDTANTMPDDEPFTLDMRTTRRSSDWVLPLAVKRTFSKGLWQGFVQGGVQINLPGSASARVDHFTETCIDLCFASGRMPVLTVAERSKYSVSWLFGAGLEYRLSPGWGLSVAPTFFGGKGQAGVSLNA
ncbi:MAG: hypothetical protein IPM81_18480 [Saprospirales bacterium]|nr:hypothetical protein [Saprospirales bacterium]